jgi:hypothetical protein
MRVRIALWLILVPSSLLAASSAYDPSWRQCKVAAECVIIQGGCGPTAVNVIYTKVAQDYYKEVQGSIECQRLLKLKSDRARCQANICEAEVQ